MIGPDDDLNAEYPDGTRVWTLANGSLIVTWKEVTSYKWWEIGARILSWEERERKLGREVIDEITAMGDGMALARTYLSRPLRAKDV